MSNAFVEVLGIAQDGGIPQPGCMCARCAAAWVDPAAMERVTCLGVVDPVENVSFLVEATPDFRSQHHDLTRHAPLAGILLTHAHLGHYTGLAHVGKEAMNLARLPVLASGAMHDFLATNAPWSQLLHDANIAPVALDPGVRSQITGRIGVTAFTVPHRAEWSDTLGFRFEGPERSLLFVPDIDRWETWDRDAREVIGSADVALIDGTFFSDGEVPGRDPTTIPHPTIERSMRLFSGIATDIRFIHFNHSNPVVLDTTARRLVEGAGFALAVDGDRIAL